MKNAPSFQYYPADMATDPEVMFWDMEQLGAYHQMIDHLWLNGGQIEYRIETVRKLFRIHSQKRAVQLWDRIKSKFILEDGHISHKRVTLELQKQAAWRLKSSLGGKHSAEQRARKAKGSSTGHLQPKGNPSSSSSSSIKTPYSPPGDNGGLFNQFWKIYPKKIGKGAAQAAWKKKHIGKTLLPQILAAVATQAASQQWQKDNGQFIPNPATWLNQGRWQDEVEVKRAKRAPPSCCVCGKPGRLSYGDRHYCSVECSRK